MMDKVDPIELRKNVAAIAVLVYVLADMPEPLRTTAPRRPRRGRAETAGGVNGSLVVLPLLPRRREVGAEVARDHDRQVALVGHRERVTRDADDTHCVAFLRLLGAVAPRRRSPRSGPTRAVPTNTSIVVAASDARQPAVAQHLESPRPRRSCATKTTARRRSSGVSVAAARATESANSSQPNMSA